MPCGKEILAEVDNAGLWVLSGLVFWFAFYVLLSKQNSRDELAKNP